MPQRLLEVNTPLIWHWPHVLSLLETLQRYRFTGLIIHQQTILALLAPPSPTFQGADRNNLFHERESALHYLRRIGRLCRQRRLTLWLQGEAFPNDGKLAHKYPELRLTDDPDQGQRFLQHFYQAIVSATLATLPDVSGLILSLQTPEFHPRQWDAPLDALYRQLRRQNKKLVLRDYTDDDWPRRQLQSTVARMPADVRASLKATAVDYRPGFANNPAIGAMGARKIWIDIDLWGIDYGWTLLPCLLIDELQGRLSWAQSVAGDRLETITARLDWEWIHNSPLQGSINEGNLYGLARIAGGETPVSAAQLLDEWLDSQGLRPGYPVQRQTVRQLFISSYDWMCRTPYLLGRVMHQHSQLPADIDTALRLLHSDARSANWRQSFQALFPRDDEQAGRAPRELLQLEQQQNAFLAERLHAQAQALRRDGELPAAFADVLCGAWASAVRYTRLFGHARQVISLRWYIDQYGANRSRRETLLTAIDAAQRYAEQTCRWLAENEIDLAHNLPLLLDPARLSRLAESCRPGVEAIE